MHSFDTIWHVRPRRAGVDTVTAMRIVGHKSEKMHKRYNSASEADLSQAATKLDTYLSNTLVTPVVSFPVNETLAKENF